MQKNLFRWINLFGHKGSFIEYWGKSYYNKKLTFVLQIIVKLLFFVILKNNVESWLSKVFLYLKLDN